MTFSGSYIIVTLFVKHIYSMSRTFFLSQFEISTEKSARIPVLRFFFAGLLLPCGFAPFHMPGMAILALALFYFLLIKQNKRAAFWGGLMFGLGFFGLGISWIYISIHDYGHLHGSVAALLTLLFLLYLSLFPALVASIFTRCTTKPDSLFACLFFTALWTGSEYLRANFLTGFPWLLSGFSQYDSPLKYLLPILGVYGAGFFACLAATFFARSFVVSASKARLSLCLGVMIILLPLALKNIVWGRVDNTPVSVGVIQTNMSMRDKWDETLFWQLLQRYQHDTEELLGTQLIVLPESAIPLPPSYISDFLSTMHLAAKKAGSAILLGIPQPATVDEEYYYNSLTTLGHAKGTWLKQHLVPFGEYMPKPFLRASNWLGIPDANMKPGKSNQNLLKVHRHRIASLICYEVGYAALLRQQLPEAEWIVSISDDGWFGRSFAIYQQLQMSQVLSLQSARYQVVANNDGLSSVIDSHGEIVASLPAFSEGLLKSSLYPASGKTVWVSLGDAPTLLSVLFILIAGLIFHFYRQK